MSKNDGGPAFPRDHVNEGHNGMTLRDYFAAKAMQGWFASFPPDAPLNNKSDLALFSYGVADAMLKERDR